MDLDIVEMVLEVEERFGIALDDDAGSGMRTVADLADAVAERLPSPRERAAILNEVRQIASACSGVAIEKIEPGSEFVRDLGDGVKWRASGGLPLGVQASCDILQS